MIAQFLNVEGFEVAILGHLAGRASYPRTVIINTGTNDRRSRSNARIAEKTDMDDIALAIRKVHENAGKFKKSVNHAVKCLLNSNLNYKK